MNIFNNKDTGREKAYKASIGMPGYDNPRENIDPRIVTKALISREINGNTLKISGSNTSLNHENPKNMNVISNMLYGAREDNSEEYHGLFINTGVYRTNNTDNYTLKEYGILCDHYSQCECSGSTAVYVDCYGQYLSLNNDDNFNMTGSSHTFSNAGNYNVLLNSRNFSGASTYTESNYGMTGAMINAAQVVSGSTLNQSNYGVQAGLISTPGGTGTLNVTNYALYGSSLGTTTDYGLYLGSCDKNRMGSDNIETYWGTGEDVFINYTGTVWNFDVEKATSEIVFNNSGFDTNFRIESDNNANMFFIDAGLNRVGILTNTPASTLDVRGDISGQSVFSSSGFTGTGAYTNFQISGGLIIAAS